MAPPRPRPSPALMDDLVEEILLRIPPDDPRSLVRAGLVCKRWHSLVSNPVFRRRSRDLHLHLARPPMLGFFYRRGCATRFMPTSSFRAPEGGGFRDWRALDARGGRVLFLDDGGRTQPAKEAALVVWSPITDELRRLPAPFLHSYCSWNAALLYGAAAGGGNFSVVVVSTERHTRFTSAFVCSPGPRGWFWSDAGRLREPCKLMSQRRGTLVCGGELYFLRELGNGILKCDLRRRQLSVIKLPPACIRSRVELMVAAEDDGGGLGFAVVRDLDLRLWSRDESYGGRRSGGWTQRRVIELGSLLPAPALSFSPCMIAAADGVGVIFVWAGDAGVFTVGLKSGQVNKVFDGHIAHVIPYYV